MKKKCNISWFSIIEVMIAIFIFAMGMASIFMVINGSMNANTMNKNYIIASNLAREQIEIIRNIRDNNYANFRKWNYIPNSWPNKYDNIFNTGTYYKVENDYTDANYPFNIKDDWNQIFTNNSKQDFKDGKYEDYKLYLDPYNHYTYNTWTWTIFYRYLHIEDLKDSSWSTIPETIKLTSKVIWYQKWYHDFEIKTILANFNRY